MAGGTVSVGQYLVRSDVLRLDDGGGEGGDKLWVILVEIKLET